MPGILQFWQDNDIMSEKGTGHNGLDIIKVGTFKRINTVHHFLWLRLCQIIKRERERGKREREIETQ